MNKKPFAAAVLPGSPCPAAERLAEYIDQAGCRRCRTIERHLCECDACRELVVCLSLEGRNDLSRFAVH